MSESPVSKPLVGPIPLLLILLLIFVFGWWMAGPRRREAPKPLIGTKAPPLRGGGWINGEAPKPDDLRGKIIFVDAWAYWCGPCFVRAPEVLALHRKYGPQGVVFLSATDVGAVHLSESKEFLEKAKIPWPSLYAAYDFFETLRIESLPTLVVIDQDGKVAALTDDPDVAEHALSTALARK